MTEQQMRLEIQNLRSLLVHAELALHAAIVDGCGTDRCWRDECDDCRLVNEVLADIRRYTKAE